ncbi:MAG TPA: selenium cofactor biosynthesis protein YqeC, partial [Anaerolineales bacterium]|nr:selenium cofactor biosynthesis protein YqeC [Anaerolineales bacterium]
ARQVDAHFTVTRPADLDRPARALPPGLVLFTGPPLLEKDGQKRLSGLSPTALDRLSALAEEQDAPLLIEADGSRQRPLKAPADHEPPIPPSARQVVIVAGLHGLGRKLDANTVHRPHLFGEIGDLAAGQIITPAVLARVLLHPQGGRKNLPPSARAIILLAGADSSERQAQGRWLAGQLQPVYDAVLIGNLESRPQPEIYAVHEPAAGVILAAGGSTRLGRPKQLLTWRNQPLVRRAALTALTAGLLPLIVVTGASAEQVSGALEGLPVQIRHNSDWQAGQSTSLRVGVSALPANAGSATFLMTDQLFLNPPFLRSLVEMHAAALPPIVAPLVDGQRANPVLFDRRAFADLRTITGDIGGRALFSRYTAAWLDWHDSNLLYDIDMPEDVARFQNLD